MILRFPDPEDQLAQLIGLTEKGSETIFRAMPLAANAIDELTHNLTGEEKDQLKHCLRKILVHLVMHLPKNTIQSLIHQESRNKNAYE